MIATLLANWRIVLAVGLVLAAGLVVWRANDAAYDRGRADVIAEQVQAERERTNDANAADDAARRCAADPTCRLQSDGYRRD